MKTRIKILNLLLKKRYLSGQEIAKLCNLTRVAVWKHINYFIDHGIKIKVHPNRGYELLNLGNTVLPEVIHLNLNTNYLGKNIIWKDLIDSTNEYAKRLLDTKPPEGTVIIAEQQTKGKGRKATKWFSTKNKDLLFSIILYPQIPYPYLPIFNIIATLAVAIAIREICRIDAFTKWPNDVLVNNKKIAGSLTEFMAEIDSIEKLILGIGINVNSFPKIKSATSLIMVKRKEWERAELLCKILENIEEFYNLIREENFIQIGRLWRKYSCDYGRKVLVKKGRIILCKGRSLGIDEYGNLVIKQGRSLKTIYPLGILKIII